MLARCVYRAIIARIVFLLLEQMTKSMGNASKREWRIGRCHPTTDELLALRTASPMRWLRLQAPQKKLKVGYKGEMNKRNSYRTAQF